MQDRQAWVAVVWEQDVFMHRIWSLSFSHEHWITFNAWLMCVVRGWLFVRSCWRRDHRWCIVSPCRYRRARRMFWSCSKARLACSEMLQCRKVSKFVLRRECLNCREPYQLAMVRRSNSELWRSWYCQKQVCPNISCVCIWAVCAVSVITLVNRIAVLWSIGCRST